MTSDEAGRLLVELLAAFPQTRVTDQTARVWYEQLAGYRFDAALAAARYLIGGCDRMPSIAQVIEQTRDETRRIVDYDRLALPAGEPEPAPTPEQVEERRRQIRDLAAHLGRRG